MNQQLKLTAAATASIPRRVMVLLTLIYAFVGLFGRDPWKNDDAEGFGVMWTLAHGSWSDWLLPHLAGRDELVGAPLPYWIGALMIKLFGGILGETSAARLIVAICFIATAATIWYATYLLGRRAEVQPMKFAFGGQPSSKEYGKTLADGALLIFLACVGLAIRVHETSPMMLELLGLSFLLYGTVRGLDKPLQGGFLAGIGLVVLRLSGMLWATVFLGLGSSAALLVYQSKTQLRWLLTAAITLLIGLSIWPMMWYSSHLTTEVIHHTNYIWWGRDQLLGHPSLESFKFFSMNFWFYAWPVWPLSGLSIYYWSYSGLKGWRAAHLAIPTCIFIAELLFLLFIQELSERFLIILVPPMAILAAFALPFLKRSIISFIDWLALISFTILAGFIWIIWLAKMTGFPRATANNLARYLPGFVAHFSWSELIIALIITALWVLVIRWRTSRAPQVIWRCVVISAAGTTLMWGLLMTLWLPTINYAKTYRHVANRFALAVPAGSKCIDTTALGDAQLASFIYFTKLNLQDNPACDLRITHTAHDAHESAIENQQNLQLIWEDRRASDRDEKLRLYRVTKKSSSESSATNPVNITVAQPTPASH